MVAATVAAFPDYEFTQPAACAIAEDGLTVLAVLHDLPLAAHFFPRLVLLDEGRIVADGPAAEVLSPDRIREVYEVDPRYVPSLV